MATIAAASPAMQSPLSTPQQATEPFPPHQSSYEDPDLDQKTPTKDTFIHSINMTSTMNGMDDDSLVRSDSKRSLRSARNSIGDADMDDGGDPASGNESDSNRPTKKKKGQRFYCTDFPPCSLSFTRSEHLARHIRKHTGERPFQCHCLRRFSRLDNLRQHAQTVHVNEEIPPESLAATGTRFQRQIRTDRMKPSPVRSRASTLGSQSGQVRGHIRNYSGSSIASVSDLGSPDDARRRPQPLAMAQSPTSRNLSVDTHVANTNELHYPYYNGSPTGYNTPTPIFPGGAGSPMMTGLQSPIALVPRSTVLDRTPGRRLSVGAYPYQHTPSSSISSIGPMASSPTSSYSHGGSSFVTSPTNASYPEPPFDQDRAEASYKRRTWHPGAYYGGRPATSGLSWHQTPDAPAPVAASQPAAAQSAVRLPGIDSFDRAGFQPAAPLRRPPSPMELDSPSRRDSLIDPQLRSPRTSWSSAPQNLDLFKPPEFSQVSPQTPSKHHAMPAALHTGSVEPVLSIEPPTDRGEEHMTPRSAKRHGWYNEPFSSSPPNPLQYPTHEPPHGGKMDYQAVIVHRNGEMEPISPAMPVGELQKQFPINNPVQTASQPSPPSVTTRPAVSDTNRLDALVAVATSEQRSTINS